MFTVTAPSTGLRWSSSPRGALLDRLLDEIFRHQERVVRAWAVAETYPTDHPFLEHAISVALDEERWLERAKWRLEQERLLHPDLEEVWKIVDCGLKKLGQPGYEGLSYGWYR